jgi:hypothetical protein
MLRTRHSLLAAAIAAALAGPAFAAAPMSSLPPEQHHGGVTFVTGGVGEDQWKAFEQAESRYPLALEFVRQTKPREEFVADVAVTIRDAKGAEILNTTADGPFLLARLPAGEYKVSATHDAKTYERTVRVGETGHGMVVFRWPAA